MLPNRNPTIRRNVWQRNICAPKLAFPQKTRKKRNEDPLWHERINSLEKWLKWCAGPLTKCCLNRPAQHPQRRRTPQRWPSPPPVWTSREEALSPVLREGAVFFLPLQQLFGNGFTSFQLRHLVLGRHDFLEHHTEDKTLKVCAPVEVRGTHTRVWWRNVPPSRNRQKHQSRSWQKKQINSAVSCSRVLSSRLGSLSKSRHTWHHSRDRKRTGAALFWFYTLRSLIK